MRNRAAALLILTLTTSCNGAPGHDQRSTAPETTAQETTTTAIAPTTGASTSLAALATSTDASQPKPVPVARDASTFATGVVNQLIVGTSTATVPDADLWARVVSGGRVIQSTVLAESANRATVAISVAFQPTPGEGDTEPIGLRIELLQVPDGWNVIAIGYL